MVKVLEDENATLKKLLAAAMLDNAMLKELSKKLVAPSGEKLWFTSATPSR